MQCLHYLFGEASDTLLHQAFDGNSSGTAFTIQECRPLISSVVVVSIAWPGVPGTAGGAHSSVAAQSLMKGSRAGFVCFCALVAMQLPLVIVWCNNNAVRFRECAHARDAFGAWCNHVC